MGRKVGPKKEGRQFEPTKCLIRRVGFSKKQKIFPRRAFFINEIFNFSSRRPDFERNKSVQKEWVGSTRSTTHTILMMAKNPKYHT